jgi:hypothetical protein
MEFSQGNHNKRKKYGAAMSAVSFPTTLVLRIRERRVEDGQKQLYILYLSDDVPNENSHYMSCIIAKRGTMML